MTLDRRHALLALSGALSGCGGWWGTTDDQPPLPGERKPVLLLEAGTAADPATMSVPVTLPPPQRNPDWPQAGGNAAHVLQHLQGPATVQQPAWRVSIGRGDGGRLAVPVAQGGRIFTMDARARISALDAGSGRTLWSIRPDDLDEADTLMAGGLAVDGPRLYACVGTGTVLALDSGSGREIWRSTVKAPLRAGPAVLGDRLVIATADSQTLCLAASDGAELWRHLGFAEGASFLGGSTPAFADGVIVTVYPSGDVIALTPDTGQVLWSDSVLRPRRTIALAAIGDIDGLPVIDNGRVFVTGNGGETASFELQQGNRLWDLTLASASTPWIAGEFVWLVSDRGELVCLLRASGRVRWVVTLPALEVAGDTGVAVTRWSGPLLAAGRLVVVRSDGRVLLADATDGRIVAEGDVGGRVFEPPILVDGTLYILTENADLRAFR